MDECEACPNPLPREQVVTIIDDKLHHFCSEMCRDYFLAQRCGQEPGLQLQAVEEAPRRFRYGCSDRLETIQTGNGLILVAYKSTAGKWHN